MEKWNKATLSDVCDLVAGFAFKSKDFGSYESRVIKIANIIPPSVDMASLVGVDLEKYDKPKLEKYIVRKGDVVLAMTGATIGKIGRIEYGQAYINQRVLLFRPKEIIDQDYLYYVLQQHKFLQYVVNHVDSESAQPNISAGTVGKYQIYLPPMDLQKKIGRVLRTYDELIELNRKINENLLVQAKTIKKQWVATNKAGYEMLPLAEVATINPDTYSPKEAWEFVNYLDTSSITDGFVADIQHIVPSSEKLPSRARRKVAAGDVLFSTVRPNQNHFGIISDPLPNTLASTGFADIRSKTPLVCNELIYLCLTEGDFIEKMQQLAEQSTSTFPAIKPSDLGACQIPCPKDESSNVFNDTLKTLFSLIAANFRENNSLGAMRDALLPKLMSGELDVSDIDL